MNRTLKFLALAFVVGAIIAAEWRFDRRLNGRHYLTTSSTNSTWLFGETIGATNLTVWSISNITITLNRCTNYIVLSDLPPRVTQTKSNQWEMTFTNVLPQYQAHESELSFKFGVDVGAALAAQYASTNGSIRGLTIDPEKAWMIWTNK